MSKKIEQLSHENQKFFAKLTKDKFCRKIKCVEDIFECLCERPNTEINKWHFKPTLILYISNLRDISDHCRNDVQCAINELLFLMQSTNTKKFFKIETDEHNETNCLMDDIVGSINSLIEILFKRDERCKLVYEFECVAILLTMGLKLEDYFYSEFVM